MYFINLDTMEWPLFSGDVELNPDANWVQVKETPPPAEKENTVVIWDTPVQDKNGVWTMTWLQRDLTAEELLAIKLRDIRSRVAAGVPITAEEAALLVGS